MMEPNAGGLEGDIWPFLDELAPYLVDRYFNGRLFTGGRFDTWGSEHRASAAERFTSDDVVAVSLLSVYIPGGAALELIEDRGGVIASFLREIGHDRPLWREPPASVARGSAADRLWSHLRQIDGVGWVTANKLMARKRPSLFPVYDRVIKAALQPHSLLFREALRADLQDEQLIRRLEEIRTEANVGGQISLLRILDVAIWMRNQGVVQVPGQNWRGAEPLPFGRKR